MSVRRAPRLLRLLKWSPVALVALFLLIQAVPYGRDHTNPPGSNEPAWDSARTRELARAACFDCHSNLTTWPWYSNVAPISWLTESDVKGGRETLNFSDWPAFAGKSQEAVDTVIDGSMPPWFYPILHRNAKLSASERAELVRGLEKTLGVKAGSRG